MCAAFRSRTNCMSHYRWRVGFTLVELLVVIAIIGILVALLIPAIQEARATANSLQCKNKLHQIGVAAQHFESTYRYFPSLGTFAPIGGTSWSVHSKLLPFVPALSYAGP